jgi:hypothetical protein
MTVEAGLQTADPLARRIDESPEHNLMPGKEIEKFVYEGTQTHTLATKKGRDRT